MFHWALVFLVVAVIALLFGFGGVAGLSMTAAWWLFAVGLILAVISVVVGRIGPPDDPYVS